MAYVAPIHRPSSVRHALRIKLFSAEEECLVLSKANRIEIWRFTAGEELVLFHSQRVYGTVSMLEALRPKDSDTELLFVGTDRFDYFTLAWDSEQLSLQTIDHFHDVGEKHLRDSQSQDRCVVDPTGRYMGLLLWEGVLCVLRLKSRRDQARNIDWMDQVRLSELFIKACTFLYTETGHPKIAFLYQSQFDNRDSKLSSYRFTSDDRDTVASRFDATRDRELNLDLDDIGAALLIPVEASESERRHNVRNNNNTATEPHLGGLLVVGENRLLYIDDTTRAMTTTILRTPAVFVAWARFDSTHYFLADDQGMLRLLTLITAGPVVKSLEVQAIGKTSRASSLVYYASKQLLFVGSHHGDSQLYHINLTDDSDEMVDEPAKTEGGGEKALAKDKGPEKGHKFCRLVQTFSNIGPILDFTIMDMGNREDGKANEYASGQARIVTGSGVHKDGSLRSVRSGVGLEDIGLLGDFNNVRALFPLSRQCVSGKADTLVMSLLDETRVFVFSDDGEIEEVDSFPGVKVNEETLWAANVGDGDDAASKRILVVTASAATLSEADSGMTVASWSPPTGQSISLASANDKWVLLSVDGKLLVSLSIAKDLAIAAEKDFGTDQIATVHAAPQFLDTAVVGTWMVGTIAVVDLATLRPTQASVSVRQKDDNASVPRSIVLAQVLPKHLSGPTLFVAMDDGTVVTFSVNMSDRTLHSKKSIGLGTRHANLHLLPQLNGTYNIFATTEHPSLIYGSEGRIVYAAVTAQDANVVCPFDSEAFPDAIVVASHSSIKLARPDTQKQTHVQTIRMGETIRRIAYSPAEKVFALGCINVEIVRGMEVPSCSVKLVDEILFRPVGTALQLNNERGELVESVVRAELLDSQGSLAERFLVGTSYIPADQGTEDEENSMGRLLVIGIDSERNPYIVSAHRMRGPIRRLAVLDGKIVIGLSKTVILSDYIETSSTSAKLKKLASFRAATFVVDLAVQGNYIAVGDMMKSTTIVEYIPASKASDDKDSSEGHGNAATVSDDDDDDDEKKKKMKPAQLVGRARYYQASWATAVCHVENETWLEADGYGNLTVLERNANGVTEEDRRRLRYTCEMNLGEMVNRMVPISVETNPSAMVHPKAFLATVEGAIYMFGTVADNAQDLLMRLQVKLEDTVKGLGKTSFSSYRGFRNQEREAGEPLRFLDGEMLERFLDLDEELQKEVAKGLGPSVEDLRNTIEELKRLH
ncbi:hypothetical protein SBRCBS47491_001064 [Sporothrix bragantina]|uniref:DNA damage-binding protein 1 n=1 Tax=Sporothrix bragantina TaxID=671064 RepID=A0ABP0AVH2_9PEZI